MAASADLVVNIVTKLSGDGMAQADKQTSKFKSGLSSASKVAGAALLGIGAAALGAANAAAEDAKSQTLLANAMTNGAHASKAQIAATEDWIDAQSRATGVTDDELRPALATLVKSTGDVEKSQRALKVAMDVSASTGKPLKAVTEAMAKGYAGQTTALGRLVPGLSQAALKSGDMAKVMAELQAKTGGAAKAAGDTAAGKMLRFKNSLGETQEAIGGALLPALDKLSGVLMTLGQWAQDHGTMFAIIAGGVAVFAAAIIALNLAVTIYTAVTTLAGSATLMAWLPVLLPVLAVVAAVLLVVGAVVLLWKKSVTFRRVVLAVWAAIKTAAAAVGRFLVSMWQSVSAGAQRMAGIVRAVFNTIRSIASAVGNAVKVAWRLVWSAVSTYVRAYVTVIRAVFTAIRTAVSTITGWIHDAWRTMWDGISSMAQTFQTKVGQVWDAIRTGASKVAAPFTTIRNAIQSVIDAVNSLIGALGRIHVPKISLPHIPGLSAAAAPTLAGVGDYAAPAVAAPRTGAGRGFAGGTVINVYGAVDPEGTARQVRRLLAGHDQRVGLRVS